MTTIEVALTVAVVAEALLAGMYFLLWRWAEQDCKLFTDAQRRDR